MWPYFVWYYPMLVWVNSFPTVQVFWPFPGQYQSTFESSHHVRHFVFSITDQEVAQTTYNRSSLLSIRKRQPKERLPEHLWKLLGEYGIRKPFRSKRHRRSTRSYWLPVVDTTGIPSSNHTAHSLPSFFVSNVRSLLPKVDELFCVLKQNDVDIACITETWLSDYSLDSAVSLQDYVFIRKDRQSPCGGIGVVLSPLAYLRKCYGCISDRFVYREVYLLSYLVLFIILHVRWLRTTRSYIIMFKM